jgi:hypothetical protein
MKLRKPTAPPPKGGAIVRTRHPAFGALKDIVHVPPGVDLTEPTEPEWEKLWLEANAWWIDDPRLNPKS